MVRGGAAAEVLSVHSTTGALRHLHAGHAPGVSVLLSALVQLSHFNDTSIFASRAFATFFKNRREGL